MASPVSYTPGQHNTITAVVDHVLFKKTLPERWFQWLLEIALWELRQIKLEKWSDVKTELYEVTDRRTVILDPSFVDWVKIGIPQGQYVIPLGVNADLKESERTDNDDTVSGLFSQNLPNGLDFGNYTGYLFHNFRGSYVRSAGKSMNINKGSFKVINNGSRKELLLDYDYNYKNVYIEYITDGFDPCGETVLHPYLCDYVRAAMEYRWEEEKNPTRTEASIRRKGIEMSDAYSKVAAFHNDLDPQTLINISRQNTRFTAKY